MFVSDAYQHPMWYPHISLRYKVTLEYAHTNIPLRATYATPRLDNAGSVL